MKELHEAPPLSPAGALLRSRLTVPLLSAAFVLLAAAAAIDDGAVLRGVDTRVQRAVERGRTPALDAVAEAVTALGGLTVIVLGLAVLLLVVWRRCPLLGMALVSATLARPLLEWVLKAVIDRPRPEFDRLVPGNGPSFPSGHVMAAVALWGLLPPVVALVTNRRSWWWLSVAVSVSVIGLVGFSRVYLGVHWLSDVVGALLLGSLYLLGVEALLRRLHRHRPCPASQDAPVSVSRAS